MSDFEGLFGLFGIMFGLIVAELSMLAVAIFINLASGSDAFPGSRRGQQIGLTMGAAHEEALSPYQ